MSHMTSFETHEGRLMALIRNLSLCPASPPLATCTSMIGPGGGIGFSTVEEPTRRTAAMDVHSGRGSNDRNGQSADAVYFVYRVVAAQQRRVEATRSERSRTSSAWTIDGSAGDDSDDLAINALQGSAKYMGHAAGKYSVAARTGQPHRRCRALHRRRRTHGGKWGAGDAPRKPLKARWMGSWEPTAWRETGPWSFRVAYLTALRRHGRPKTTPTRPRQ